jgi:UPF0716 protein FxsA
VFLLIGLFIVVPLVELYVIIQVGQVIGVVPTLLLLLADSIIGSVLLRSQGRAAWIAFNRALSEGRMPAREVFDGALIIFGGALLLTPGFVTDIFGVVLLIPPTRALVRGLSRRFVIGRFSMGPRAAVWGYDRVRERRAPAGAGARASRPPGAGRQPGDVIEGTAHEVRDEDLLEEGPAKRNGAPPHPDGPGSFGG